MVSSKYQWRKFLPAKDIEYANKLYHEKYLYSATISFRLAFYVRWAEKKTFEELCKALDDRFTARSRWQGFDTTTTTMLPTLVEKTQIYVLSQFIKKNKKVFRTRIENNAVMFYTVTDATMHQIFHFIKQNTDYKIKKLYLPQDVNIPRATIIVKRKPEFQYKVYIKYSKYPEETKKQFLAYIQANSSSINAPDGLISRLSNLKSRHIAGFYYINDQSLLLFIQLISPDLVKKIYTLQQQTP
jgi:hypothetical protein